METSATKSFTRSAWFWAALALSSSAGSYFAYTYGPEAFKIVNLNLKMNRSQALSKAAELSKKYQWEPLDYNEALSFESDGQTQFFVELDFGYKKFISMIQQKLYEPYLWKVRHFKEKETHEAFTTFTPEGTPYEFLLKIPEDKILPNLSSSEAQKIAESEANQNWNIDFNVYKFLEKSQTETPQGRIDHSFTYQREDEKLGEEGRYRVKLSVCGNKVTEVNRMVHVPESFSRRYQEMRASNTSIATAGHMFYLIFYLLLGGLVGCFLLIRKKRFLAKHAFYWALFLGLLQTATQINSFPLMWMYYNTAMPMSSFTINYITSILFGFLQRFFMLFITISAAESLGRYAFPNHVQFWKLWQNNAPASRHVFGQTLAGYLAAPAKVGWAIGVFLFLTTVFGWFSPASPLVDPNILATYLPWLAPFANALGAGFTEECAFRAIPLAGAALIGRKIKKEKLIVGIMVIVQAVIFAAAHANYAMQPSYFRIVEMLPMSILWGVLYLIYGLLPVIIMHWLYDLILMSIPLFTSDAPGMWKHQGIIILLGLAPLLYTFLRRYALGHWFNLPESAFNKGWTPPPSASINIPKKESVHFFRPSSLFTLIVCSLGILGAGMWVNFENFKNPFTPVYNSRESALNLAKTIMQEKDAEFTKGALFIATIQPPNDVYQKFMWRENKDKYNALIGTYLPQPVWMVRCVHFIGEISARAEEYQISIDGVEIKRIRHKFPETKPGKTLSQQEAKAIIDNNLSSYGIKKELLKEVSTESTQKPARLDWTFIFEDTSITLNTGQARIKCVVAGNELVDAEKYIHIPETWQRDFQDKTTNNGIALQLCMLLLTIFCIFAGVFIFPQFMNNFSAKQFLTVFSVITGTSLLYSINQLPQLQAMLNTAQPVAQQLFTMYSGILMQTLLTSLFGTLVICMVFSYHHTKRILQTPFTPLYGIASGFFLYAILTGVSYALPSFNPLIPSYDALSHYSALISLLTFNCVRFFRYASFALLLGIFVQTVAQRSQLISTLLVFISGFMLLGFFGIEDIGNFITIGTFFSVGLTLCFHFVFSKDTTLIPISVGTIFVIHAMHEGLLYSFYPYGLLMHAVTTLFCIFLIYLWRQQQKALS
ncbi:CPBP family intramembrane metalloprotease [Candidatus Babeliales bacterium]|nr:CPBP family intramembrane metalloprotease [Candidatus Babeliales bacterium]